MQLYGTYIKAIDPATGELKTWCGPDVPGLTQAMAQQYCQRNGLGYCEVHGLLIADIPCKPSTYKPDFNGLIDYQLPNLN